MKVGSPVRLYIACRVALQYLNKGLAQPVKVLGISLSYDHTKLWFTICQLTELYPIFVTTNVSYLWRISEIELTIKLISCM